METRLCYHKTSDRAAEQATKPMTGDISYPLVGLSIGREDTTDIIPGSCDLTLNQTLNYLASYKFLFDLYYNHLIQLPISLTWLLSRPISTQKNKNGIGTKLNARIEAFGCNFLFRFGPVIRNPDDKSRSIFDFFWSGGADR